MAANLAATRGVATGRSLDILLWCVQVLLALVFVNASRAKLMGEPEMVALFTAVGLGQWFRYATGILELTGAVLIMVPRTRSIGAALLATIMLGALTAHLLVLHVPPTAAGILLLLSGFVVWGRRRSSPAGSPALRPSPSQAWPGSPASLPDSDRRAPAASRRPCGTTARVGHDGGSDDAATRATAPGEW